MRFAWAFIGLLFVSHPSHAQSANATEAKWLLERLTGVKWPADSAVLSQMESRIASGDKRGAAEIATAQPQFLSVLVKEMAAKMSTRDETVREPLNDFTATFIGVTRDGIDARQLLFGNFLYKGDQTKLTGLNIPDDILQNNNHYTQLERANVNLGDVLIKVDGQRVATSATASVPSPDPAGVLTSRAFLGAHAIAGTNRRLVEYTFRQFMCVEIGQWADTASFDNRVGRDIDRAPGGDAQRYLTTCKGCHTVMDGFRGAFAKWDFRTVGNNSAAMHTASGSTTNGYRSTGDANGIVPKMNRADFIQYPGGYVTVDDSFVNNANRGVNAVLFGWRGMAPDPDGTLASRTTGVHAFGRLVAGSRRFSSCMAKRVWDSVCKHDLSESEMDALFVSFGMEFESGAYNLRKLFEIVATHPKCRLTGGV